MGTLRILSAGAAQAVTERMIEDFRRERDVDVVADFGAVGAMKARVIADEPVDVIILTQAMIEELIAARRVEAGSRIDLGRVGTGVAVRRGVAAPDVTNADSLREAILASSKIVCPDPAIATAGKIVMRLMDELGVTESVSGRMQFFPNGYASMRWLAAEGGAKDLGITQVTEILPNPGVHYVGPLPDAFQMKTIYSMGLSSSATDRAAAAAFVGRFQGPEAQTQLRQAGYELD